jgi:hypothetical protein
MTLFVEGANFEKIIDGEQFQRVKKSGHANS